MYRDVKPENILLDADGHVLLTDFNTARLIGGSGCSTVLGTAEYMAPELLRGERYDVAADWWVSPPKSQARLPPLSHE